MKSVIASLPVFLLCVSCLFASSPDEFYQEGMKLAAEKRYAEAIAAFLAGEKAAPRDKRFPTELAGVAFQQHRYNDSKKYLKRAESIDPNDAYTQQFLGTVFYLQDNLDAALLHWNRIGLPRIENVSAPAVETKPVLLDRAFRFSPASILRLSDLQQSRANLDMLDIFSKYSFNLTARKNQTFDLEFHPMERNGWGSGRLETAVSFLHGLPYQSVCPEFYNWKGRAINFQSLVRWDSDKRRLLTELSAPLQGNPARRYAISIDGRREEWQISGSPQFELQKAQAAFSLASVLSPEWRLRNEFRVSTIQLQNAGDLVEGPAIEFYSVLSRRIELAEHRSWITNFLSLNFGRLFNEAADRYLQVAAGSEFKAKAFTLNLRGGKSFGQPPLDHIYMLGVERDTDLWLRGHSALTRKKGSLPLGDDFVLFNSEADKQIYRKPFLQARVGPFFDFGRTWGASVYGPHRWLFDSGIQTKLHVLGGLSAQLVYGRDLRSGNQTFYINLVR